MLGTAPLSFRLARHHVSDFPVVFYNTKSIKIIYFLFSSAVLSQDVVQRHIEDLSLVVIFSLTLLETRI